MRAVKQNEKHYGGQAKPGSDGPQTSQRVTPANPNRTMLLIQNTGAETGLVRFEEPIQGDGSDLSFAAGSGLLFDRGFDTCPKSAINIGSANGTTFCIIEQVTES